MSFCVGLLQSMPRLVMHGVSQHCWKVTTDFCFFFFCSPVNAAAFVLCFVVQPCSANGLCCAALRYAALRCAVLCCAVLCCAVLCCAVLCCAVLC